MWDIPEQQTECAAELSKTKGPGGPQKTAKVDDRGKRSFRGEEKR